MTMIAKDKEFNLVSIIPGEVPTVQITTFTILPEYEVKKDFSPETALREAVSAYLMSEEGKAIAHENGDDFNWGDAVLKIPNNVWRNHGLILMAYQQDNNITVNHDENLFSDIL